VSIGVEGRSIADAGPNLTLATPSIRFHLVPDADGARSAATRDPVQPPWGQMTEELLTHLQLADELQVSVRTLER
jgi:hypothetical protein